MDIVTGVIGNVGLLCIAATLLFLGTARFGWPVDDRRRQLLFGLVFGAISALVVAFPIPGPLGAQFDMRAGPIVLAGVIGGPLGGFVAAAIGALARSLVGGPAALGGGASFFLYAAAGIAYGWAMRRGRLGGLPLLHPLGLLALALLATVAVLPCFFIDPTLAGAMVILGQYWHVLVLENLLGIVLLGLLIGQMQDIAESRNRYRLEQETSQLARRAGAIGIWSYDFRSRQHKFDPIAREILGLDPQQQPDEDVSIFRHMIHPEDFFRVDRQIAAARRGGTPVQLSFRICRPDGRIRHIRTTTIFLGSSEAPDLMIGVGLDETEDVRLRKDMILRGAALESAADGILIAEAGGDTPIVYANRRLLAMSGHRAVDDILGRNCLVLAERLSEQPGLDEMRTAIAMRSTCTVTLQHVRQNGSLTWYRIAISPLRDADGEVRHLVGVLTDVTEPMAMRRETEIARDQLQAILHSTPDAILTIDEDRKITRFNPAAERLFGWPAADILGLPIETLVPQGMHDRHRTLVAGYIADPDARTGSMTGLRIIRARRRDDSTFPALISLSRFVIAGRTAVAATAHDMTEMINANDRLTRLSFDLTAKLNAARAASDAKSQFLAHMSHELRTPLTAILGFADLIRWTGVENIRPEKLSGYVEDIHSSGTQLLGLINDVLDLSKIESDAFPIELRPCDPQALVDGAVETIRPIADAKDIHLDVALHLPDTASLRCDRRATHQCLLNLLSNAVKFSAVGRHVRVTVTQADGALRFAVRDDGVGMPPEMVQRIGQPYLRAAQSHLNSAEGTGLGLAITKGLLDRQDARLEVESEPGTGSTFTIVFPAITARAESAG